MHPKYRKLIDREEPGPLRPLTGLLDIRLRITLGDMPLDEAFEAGVPGTDVDGTLGALLERLFGGEGDWSPSDDDLAKNPDLPDLIEELEAILRSASAGRSDARFFVNHGPEARLEDPVGGMCRGCPAPGDEPEAVLLDLVIEQRFTPLAYSVGLGHWGSRDELREHLETQALLASDLAAARRPATRTAGAAVSRPSPAGSVAPACSTSPAS